MPTKEVIKIRRCGRCGLDKSLSEFSSRGEGRLQSYCIPCNKEHKKEWYQENKKHVREEVKKRKFKNRVFLLNYLLKQKCRDCGETDPVVLEFDHLRDKKHNVMDMAHRGYSIEKILEEIEKCEVVCANDHKRRTAKRAGWLKLTGVGGMG